MSKRQARRNRSELIASCNIREVTYGGNISFKQALIAVLKCNASSGLWLSTAKLYRVVLVYYSMLLADEAPKSARLPTPVHFVSGDESDIRHVPAPTNTHQQTHIPLRGIEAAPSANDYDYCIL